ncbi:MAG: hypothetical protein Q9220_007448 [cf. Caloplaca sp. 1 TL-2023]
MPALSYGLNVTKKSSTSVAKPTLPCRRPIFDDDSGSDDDSKNAADNAESIRSVGGLTGSLSSQHQSSREKEGLRPTRPLHSAQASQLRDLATNHSTSKHAHSAQTLDPSIYEYDAVYDSLHVQSVPADNGSSDVSNREVKKPKYMQSLLAAAETRKRDQLRAKEKMLAKERELEGDEFADKEKFVTVAYKKQQEELRKAEAEEVLREREAAERQRVEGGGLKGMYKTMLAKNEEKHATALKSVEEAIKNGNPAQGHEEAEARGNKKKSEAEVAIEKGAMVNEDGQVVDKRQLLNAGLNARMTSSKAPPSATERKSINKDRRIQDEPRERVTRGFEDAIPRKRSPRSERDDDRASKSRKMEDEILASLGL